MAQHAVVCAPHLATAVLGRATRADEEHTAAIMLICGCPSLLILSITDDDVLKVDYSVLGQRCGGDASTIAPSTLLGTLASAAHDPEAALLARTTQ